MKIIKELIQHSKPCWIGSPQGPHYLCADIHAIEFSNGRNIVKIANGVFDRRYPAPRIVDVPLEQISYVSEKIQLGIDCR